MYMSPTPKPLWSKRSLVLMLLVLGAGLLLASAATISMIKEKEPIDPVSCSNEMMVTVVFSKNTESSSFELIDHSGNHYLPVLESNKSILSKTGPAKICFSSLEKNIEAPGRIHVNKIEYLPLPNEGK